MTDKRRPNESADRLVEAARRLPEEIRPRRDLWPDIKARLRVDEEPAASPGRWRLAPALAAGVALVALSSAITLWVTDRPPHVVVRNVPTTNSMLMKAGTVTPGATFGSSYALGPKYERARQDLASELETTMESLPPETQETVKRNLQQIREALAELNKELASDPNNVLLQQLLMATYQDELAVLMNVNKMVQTLPTRTEI